MSKTEQELDQRLMQIINPERYKMERLRRRTIVLAVIGMAIAVAGLASLYAVAIY